MVNDTSKVYYLADETIAMKCADPVMVPDVRDTDMPNATTFGVDCRVNNVTNVTAFDVRKIVIAREWRVSMTFY